MVDIISPAKINLSLNILGTRPDGYHEIKTIMSTISLADKLTIKRGKIFDIKMTGINLNIEIKDNLIYKATQLFYSKANISRSDQNHEITVLKNIPAGAGLAGGSSNAIAAVIGLNHMLDNVLTFPELLEIAQTIGSDTAFFLYNNMCLCTSRGEVVTPIKEPEKIPGEYIYLFLPKIHISTAQVFKGWKAKKLIKPYCFLNNDLETIVWDIYPEMKEKFEPLRRQYQNNCMMSGSGSTYFVIADAENEKSLMQYSQSIKCNMIQTKLTNKGCYVI